MMDSFKIGAFFSASRILRTFIPSFTNRLNRKGSPVLVLHRQGPSKDRRGSASRISRFREQISFKFTQSLQSSVFISDTTHMPRRSIVATISPEGLKSKLEIVLSLCEGDY